MSCVFYNHQKKLYKNHNMFWCGCICRSFCANDVTVQVCSFISSIAFSLLFLSYNKVFIKYFSLCYLLHWNMCLIWSLQSYEEVVFRQCHSQLAFSELHASFSFYYIWWNRTVVSFLMRCSMFLMFMSIIWKRWWSDGNVRSYLTWSFLSCTPSCGWFVFWNTLLSHFPKNDCATWDICSHLNATNRLQYYMV